MSMSLFARCLLRRVGRQLSAVLVISALIGALYGDRLHAAFALGACGGVLLASAWLAYLGKRLPSLRRGRKPPDYLTNPARQRRRPAFRMDYRDFDDDLNRYTAADEQDLTESEARRLAWLARLITALCALVLSQFVPGI